ncbi:hypothetical protein [Sphaerisporangium aureirubrum]|uniref:Uncharacterized protein n=1 Tax=Sphaerisporangium aureirubrum TaxID=1544736 RepID=A0ABW1NC68_9ACTN
MTFEEQILVELKEEFAARAERRRRSGRRLVAGAAAGGLAAAAAVVLPLVTGAGSPAYAVTKNPDGTIRLELHEFRDADRLEQDLRDMGVAADVTYTKPGWRCEPGRGEIVGSDIQRESDNGDFRRDWRNPESAKLITIRDGGWDIEPRYLREGQTLVMEFAESDGRASGPVRPRVVWQLAAYVVNGPVGPCVVAHLPAPDGGGTPTDARPGEESPVD